MRTIEHRAPHVAALVLAGVLAGVASAQDCPQRGTGAGLPPPPSADPPRGSSPAAPGTGGPAVLPPGLISAAQTPFAAAYDRSEWWTWWAYHSELYLGLDDARARIGLVSSGRDAGSRASDRRAGLSLERVYGYVVPALIACLADGGDDVRLVRSALLALGRIGEAPPDLGFEAPRLVDPIAARLADDRASVAEAAVIALGTLASPQSVLLLGELCGDTAVARERVDRPEVPIRMRAFAAYGLGVSGGAPLSPEVRRFAVHALTGMLDSDAVRYPDVQAAAVIGLGLCPTEGRSRDRTADAPAASGLDAQVRWVLELLADQRRPALARAHAPTALARLLAADESVASGLRDEVLAVLLATLREREPVEVRRSAIVALGAVADAGDGPLDRAARAELLVLRAKGDLPSRHFATMSLAHVAARPGRSDVPFEGTAAVVDALARALARGKSSESPWAALALGVLGHELRAAGGALPIGAADALRSALVADGAGPDAAAYALALGLVRDARAFEQVSAALGASGSEDRIALTAVGLGLLRQSAALEPLAATMADALHRPVLLEGGALGRALIGDRTLIEDLIARLDDCDCEQSTQAVCRALAWVADVRAVTPLVELAVDESAPRGSRANAAEALGRIADRAGVSWDVRISSGLNYVDAPTSLSDPTGYGILDTF